MGLFGGDYAQIGFSREVDLFDDDVCEFGFILCACERGAKRQDFSYLRFEAR